MSPMRAAARAVHAVLPEAARREIALRCALRGVRGALAAGALRRIVRAVAPYTMVVPAGVAFAIA